MSRWNYQIGAQQLQEHLLPHVKPPFHLTHPSLAKMNTKLARCISDSHEWEASGLVLKQWGDKKTWRQSRQT